MPDTFYSSPEDEQQALADYYRSLNPQIPQQMIGQGAANAVNNLFAPVGDVPRYQTWPETMVRSGAILPIETYRGNVPTNLGLRREDFTDIPDERKPSDTFVGRNLGLREGKELGPSGELIERTQDLAGMAGGGSVVNVERGNAGTLGTNLIRNEAADILAMQKQHHQGIIRSDTSENAPLSALAKKPFEVIYAKRGNDAQMSSDTEVLKNPSQREFSKFVKENDALRTFTDKDDNLYVWNARDATHEGIAGNLGLRVKDWGNEWFKSNGKLYMKGDLKGGYPDWLNKLSSDSAEAGAPLAALERAPVFFSAVEKAVKDAKMPKADGEQWLGYLHNQPGVKQEELDWVLGDLPKGQITKPELEQFVKDHKIELKEVNKGDEAKLFTNEMYKKYGLGSYGNGRFDNALMSMTPEELAKYEHLNSENNNTKYSQWQLPGGNNYLEQLLTLPEKESAREIAIQKRMSEIDKETNGGYTPEYKTLQQEYNNIRQQTYTSSHWNEPNVLAHIRTNERQIPGVGNSLHIEEIQSDWHQAGRKQGYKGEAEKLKPDFDAIEKKIVDSGDEAVMSHPELRDALAEAIQKKIITADEAKTYARYVQIENTRARSPVPDAPFKTNWADLALKRIIRHAAETGKDSISWTPGEAQTARYDLSKHIDRLGLYGSGEIKRLIAWDKNKSKAIDKQVTDRELSDIVGKEAAEKLLAKEPYKAQGGDERVLENADLKVGGEGMKAFYDKILVDKANAIAKKFGGKVEQSELSGDPRKFYVEKIERFINGRDYYEVRSTENDKRTYRYHGEPFKTEAEANSKIQELQKQQPVHVLRITPQLRDAALNKGFSLFADSGKVGAPLAALTRVEHNPFKLGELEQQHGVNLTPVEHNPFTVDTYHGTLNFKGDQIHNKNGYEVHHNKHTGEDTYSVWDVSNKRTISPEFKSEAEASHFIDKRVGSEFFSTPNPELASGYAQNSVAPAVLPLKINAKDYHTFDAKGGSWTFANAHAIYEAEQLGKKGVIIKNVRDNPNDSSEIEAGIGKDFGPQTVYITLDPSTVRSRFAKFDPAKFHESGLMKASGLPIITDKDGNQLDHNLKPMTVDEQNALLNRNPLPTHKGADGKAVAMPSKTALALAAAKAAEYAIWAARPTLGPQLWAASILTGAAMNARSLKQRREGQPLGGYKLTPVDFNPFK